MFMFALAFTIWPRVPLETTGRHWRKSMAIVMQYVIPHNKSSISNEICQTGCAEMIHEVSGVKQLEFWTLNERSFEKQSCYSTWSNCQGNATVHSIFCLKEVVGKCLSTSSNFLKKEYGNKNSVTYLSLTLNVQIFHWAIICVFDAKINLQLTYFSFAFVNMAERLFLRNVVTTFLTDLQ